MHWYYSADGAAVGPHSADDIENLFATRQITAETLVWRKGFAEWTALADTDAFGHLIDDGLPPPLPAASRQATAHGGADDVLVADRLADYRPGSDRAADNYRHGDEDDDDSTAYDDDGAAGHTGFSAAHVAPVLAGPWSRYFARSIDISIIATVLLTGFYWVLPAVNLQLYLQLYFVDIRALVVLAMPVTLLVNAIIITLTGNSLGKAIFGIRAEPVDGRARFGFGGNLMREVRVWAQGLALGIPVLNFFTMIPAYRAVLRGAPAPYDTGLATVRAYSDSRLRRALGILLALALYVAITAINAVDKRAIEALALPSTWINPITQIAVSIPPGWDYEAIPTANGTVYGFTNMKTGVAAILSGETLPAGMDMASYTAATSQSLAPLTTLGAWTASGTPELWMASGQMTQGSYPSTVYIAQNGAEVWRVLYFDQLTTTPRVIVEPEMTAALFRSAGIVAAP